MNTPHARTHARDKHGRYSHGPVLEAAMEHYPGAFIVHTHRAPAKVVGSSSSIHAKMYGAGNSDAYALRTYTWHAYAPLHMCTLGMSRFARRWHLRHVWTCVLFCNCSSPHLSHIGTLNLVAVARVWRRQRPMRRATGEWKMKMTKSKASSSTGAACTE